MCQTGRGRGSLLCRNSQLDMVRMSASEARCYLRGEEEGSLCVIITLDSSISSVSVSVVSRGLGSGGPLQAAAALAAPMFPQRTSI